MNKKSLVTKLKTLLLIIVFVLSGTSYANSLNEINSKEGKGCYKLIPPPSFWESFISSYIGMVTTGSAAAGAINYSNNNGPETCDLNLKQAMDLAAKLSFDYHFFTLESKEDRNFWIMSMEFADEDTCKFYQVQAGVRGADKQLFTRMEVCKEKDNVYVKNDNVSFNRYMELTEEESE